MSGRGFDPRFMQELKQKNDIVEVIGGYAALDRKGNTHWACCPFHHERTPSFAVNQGEQFYHCFGCGVSGDVVKFVQEIESTDFMGAVRILAARAKMEVPESNFDTEEIALKRKKRDIMAQIMLDCAKFYRSNLFSGDTRAEAHLQYISNRKLAPTTVKKFGLGASIDYYSLPDYLAGKGYMKEDLLASGAVGMSKNGKLVDFEAERLIFPIINALDEVVGFGGRLLEKSDFAKYKNTSATMLFDKSKTLYNINLLKKLKRTQTIPHVIFVEGYMDTISLYQAGFENVVASMGTALTKEQARLVKRYSDNVMISYDGDFAGQKNTIRGLEILKEEGLKVRVVPLPDGKDPDDVVKQGKEAYQQCLDSAMPLIDFKLHYLEKRYDLSVTSEKRGFVKEALKIVKTAENESVKEELLQTLRKKTGVSYTALERDLENTKGEVDLGDKQDATQTKIAETASDTDKQVKAIRFILAAKLFSAPYAKDLDLKTLPIADETHRGIVAYITDREETGEKMYPSGLFEVFADNNPELNAIFNLNFEDKLTGDTAERFFKDSVLTLQNEALDKEIALYTAQYEAETDVEKKNALTKKIMECMTKKRNAKKK